jgi:hypothetical protein
MELLVRIYKPKSVAPPAEPQPDLSKLTDEEFHQFERLTYKIWGQDGGFVEAEAAKPAAAARKKRHSASKSAPPHASSAIPTRPDGPTRPDANHLRTRYAGAPPHQKSMSKAMKRRWMRRMGS